MGKKKLKRWNELVSFPNVLQLDKSKNGKWNETVFKNKNPITLELACGGGEYTVALAQKFPERNFIGIDKKGARIYKGAKQALQLNLPNAFFLRAHIDHLNEYFSLNEIHEIWITFPDPYFSSTKSKKRLTSSKFISLYKQVLISGGMIHLKTDSLFLYQFTLDTLNEMKLPVHFQTDNLYASDFADEILEVKTFYEKMHLTEGKTIKYISFGLNSN
jgi:tRNA (guanine-N7-)-methyltransferase